MTKSGRLNIRNVLATIWLSLAMTFSPLAHAGFLDHYGRGLHEWTQSAGEKIGRTLHELKPKATLKRIDGSFEDLYPTPFFQTATGKFVLIGGSAVLIATVTYFTAGGGLAAAGPISTWVGTQIGMAAGVGSGATAAGLAILGGGTVASGGLGIAGGLAVLTALSDIGIMLVLDQAAQAIPEDKLAKEKFRILRIPLPEKANKQVLKQFEAAKEKTEQLQATEAGSDEFSRLANQIEDHYRNALNLLQSIDPMAPTAGNDFIARAVLQYNFMEYDEAMRSIDAARPYVKNESFVFYFTALFVLAQGRPDALERAAAILDYVTLSEPDAIQPYILQTIVQMDLGQPSIALDKALKGLDHVADNFELNWRAAEIAFHNEGAYATAAKLYREALSQTTDNAMEALCKIMIALSYQRQGQGNKANEWYRDAIDEVKDKPEHVRQISELWWNLKEKQP